jgi:hypothetical protein
MKHSVRPIIAGMVLFCIPAFLNRSPLLFSDSRSYYIGGKMVLDRALSVVQRLLGRTTLSTEVVVTHAKAVRSIFYSLLSYLLASNMTLWAIILVQAALAAWVIVATNATFCRPARSLPLLVFLTVFSSLPWAVSMFMPDIFTPLTVLSLLCLLLGWDALSPTLRKGLLVMFPASLVMHLTNLPIALGVTVMAAAMHWRSLWVEKARWLSVIAALCVAVLAMLSVSVVGFNKWTQAAKPALPAGAVDRGWSG